ncbi:Fe-S protein assembly co-chaperone HscB [Segetibacter koreensis]|uniref:Fe-S protein assembly co-chaperone HscB n=1 Tax=Segetibacter koreensis TaxID=398037 RepID=UPI000A02F7B7|nr:Fe-S protein assembly co-chaperone HscB [Segetibacter koreensis]
MMNYFELYNLPVSFIPDMQQVKQKFYELSRKYHPDFYTNENEFEQADSLEISSEINKAYKVFQNKDETIKYVLQLKELLEDEEKYQLSSDFLMEMMELNELLTESKMGEDPAAIAAIKKIIENQQKDIYAPVKDIVEGYEEGKTTNKELLKVKEYYFKKKYLNRILAAMI